MNTGTGAGARRFLNCPRCGLSIQLRRPRLTIEHCPRCSAHARILVGLFSSTLPTAALYPPGLEPSEHLPLKNANERDTDGNAATAVAVLVPRPDQRSRPEHPLSAGPSG